MSNTRVRKLIFAMAMGAAGPALAQGYAGIAAGQGKGDVPFDVHDSATGGKLFAGYRLSSGWAVEAAYFHFGKLRIGGPAASASVKGTGGGLGLAYVAQSNGALGVVRGGFTNNKVDGRLNMGTLTLVDSRTDTKPYVGLAGGYMFTRHFGVEFGLDFSRFEVDGDDFDARLVTVGVRASF